MDLSSIGAGSSSILSLSAQSNVSPPSQPPVAPDNDGEADNVKGAASVQVSKQGRLFSQLQSLAQNDPVKFKQVLSDAANALRADAQQQQGQGSDALDALADKLQKAADTGDVSALKPQGGHGRHHHHGSGDATTQGAAQDAAQGGASANLQAAAAYAKAQTQPRPEGGDSLHHAIEQVMENLSSAVSAA
jgi:hypothetical protein